MRLIHRAALFLLTAAVAFGQNYATLSQYLNANMSSNPTGNPQVYLYPSLLDYLSTPLATPGVQILSAETIWLGLDQDPTQNASCTSKWGTAPQQGCGQGIMTQQQIQNEIDRAVAMGAKAVEVNLDPWFWLGNDTFQSYGRTELIALFGPSGYAQSVMGLRLSIKLKYILAGSGGLGIATAGPGLFGWSSGQAITSFSSTFSFNTLMNTAPSGSAGWLSASTVMGSIANDLKPALMSAMDEPYEIFGTYSSISGTCSSDAGQIGTFISNANALIVAASSGTTTTETHGYNEISCAVGIYDATVTAGHPSGEIGFDIYNFNPNQAGTSLTANPPAGLGTVNNMIGQFKTAPTPITKFLVTEMGNPSWVTSGAATEGGAVYGNGSCLWTVSGTGLNRDVTAQATLWAQSIQANISEIYLFPGLAQGIDCVANPTASNGMDRTQAVLQCTSPSQCATTWGAIVAQALSVGLQTVTGATQASPTVVTVSGSTTGYLVGQQVQFSCPATNAYASPPATPYTVTAVPSGTTITLLNNTNTAPGTAFSGSGCVIYRPQQTEDFKWLKKWAQGLSVTAGVPLGI